MVLLWVLQLKRTTLITFLVQLKDKATTTVRKAFAKKFKYLPKGLKRSLTYDQGQEMTEHKLFTKSTQIKVYFAHPHSPWERGTNENTDALIRQFFPKGTDFSKVSLKNIKRVQDMLNDRPRKTLGFLTPHEVFGKLLHQQLESTHIPFSSKATRENWQVPEEYLREIKEKQQREEEEKIEFIKIKLKEEENKKRREEIKKIEQIYNSLDPLQQEEIKIETENRLPDFWKENFNKERVKGKKEAKKEEEKTKK